MKIKKLKIQPYTHSQFLHPTQRFRGFEFKFFLSMDHLQYNAYGAVINEGNIFNVLPKLQTNTHTHIHTDKADSLMSYIIR